MGVHDGHRQRKFKQFLAGGAETMADHELLEMLLFQVMRQGDTNETAHGLIDRFGSLRAVFSASQEELTDVKGVGPATAQHIRLVAALFQRMLAGDGEHGVVLSTTEEIGDYFTKVYLTRPTEVMYLVCLDAKGKKRQICKVAEGTVSSVGLDMRKIMEYALRAGASAVALVHNHPSGLALPSHEDQIATRMLQEALAPVGIRLMDHIIVADGDYISMAQSGLL